MPYEFGPFVADRHAYRLTRQGRQVELADKLTVEHPKNPDYLYHHGAVLAAAGRKPEARKQLEEALRANPKAPEAEAIKKLLATL